MSTDHLNDDDDLEPGGQDGGDTLQAEADQEQEERPRMNLEVQVDSPSACERHMTVTIPREDVDRYYDDAIRELMPEANVPGFRPGRAPRKLVEQRFRKEVTQQIKGSLLMDSMAQISEDQNFTAISEPEFDLDAVEVPDEGPMVYEFNLEVRPEFDLPNWKGLSIERPTRQVSDEDVERRFQDILGRFGQLAPFEGAAEPGDYVTVNVYTRHGDERLATRREEVLRIQPTLSFHDARLEGFDKLLAGVRAGETREAEVELTAEAPNEPLAGKKVTVALEVLDVKRLQLPELDEEFLTAMGGFESEAELRDAIRDDLERQVAYHQSQQARQQISAKLTEKANWELPPGLLRRQSQRELERAVLELRRAGFGESEIRARQNELRQHSSVNTAKALKEHFIFERIAEEENIEAEEHDYDDEMRLIARQSGESLRRVRAQLEKRGLMDALRNQIVERKVVELVLSHANFTDVPWEDRPAAVEGIDMAAGGQPQESAEASAGPTESGGPAVENQEE